jgi:hypothetical protein
MPLLLHPQLLLPLLLSVCCMPGGRGLAARCLGGAMPCLPSLICLLTAPACPCLPTHLLPCLFLCCCCCCCCCSFLSLC